MVPFFSTNNLTVMVHGFMNVRFLVASGAVFFNGIRLRYTVTASKDGAIRLFDGVSAKCVRYINGAHVKSEVTSAVFTSDQRFVLSSGKDSTVKLWEIASSRMVKEYHGAKRVKLRSQAIYNDREEFVISIDEGNNEAVSWDARTAEKVAKWLSNHNGVPRWIIICGKTDRSVRFWKESV